MRLTRKHVSEARLVAIKAHGTQAYDGVFPYEKHLDDVVAVMRRFGFDSHEYICAAYLHDAIEDGAISYSKIKTHFGFEVAEMVYCVTDEMGRNRKEKKDKTLPKTASNPKAINLKLGDRIANIEHGGKIDMYSDEYDEFCRALRDNLETPLNSFMWKHLDNLIITKSYV